MDEIIITARRDIRTYLSAAMVENGMGLLLRSSSTVRKVRFFSDAGQLPLDGSTRVTPRSIRVEQSTLLATMATILGAWPEFRSSQESVVEQM